MILGYSSWNYFKKDNKSDYSRRRKRFDHWQDFLDNIVKLKLINNNTILSGLSVDKSNVYKDGKSVVDGTEKNVITQNLAKEHSVRKAGIDMEAVKTRVMNEAAIENDRSLLAETTDLAFYISKFFDKKLKSRTEPQRIYLTKCPCRRCQTVRRINRLSSNHQLNTSVDNQG